jgi:hypothetical protein
MFQDSRDEGKNLATTDFRNRTLSDPYLEVPSEAATSFHNATASFDCPNLTRKISHTTAIKSPSIPPFWWPRKKPSRKTAEVWK